MRIFAYAVIIATLAVIGPSDGIRSSKHDPPLLFDLQTDPGQSFDIAAAHADVIEEIKAAVEKHMATVKPVKNQLVKTAG